MKWQPPDWATGIYARNGLVGVIVIALLLMAAHLLGIIDAAALLGL